MGVYRSWFEVLTSEREAWHGQLPALSSSQAGCANGCKEEREGGGDRRGSEGGGNERGSEGIGGGRE